MIKIFNSYEEASTSIPKGSIKLLIINKKKIALAHAKDGFRAFDNACPHQHEPLHKGLITPSGEVVCALHHYRFNMKTGQEANNRCGSMNVYPIEIKDTGVFIDI